MLCGLALGLLPAEAKKGDWKEAGEFEAGGAAKVIEMNRTVKLVRFTCVKGSVTVKTLIVRDAEMKRTSFRIARTLNEGDDPLVVMIGDQVKVTSLRISDEGKGTYRVALQ
jgi:hypothetical protein